MSKRPLPNGRSAKGPRHARLHQWVADTCAWKSLDATARALYMQLSLFYFGNNNGRIAYSVRQAAEELHVSKGRAWNAFRDLRERGFIVAQREGHFDRKTKHATEWRLTEHGCNVTNALPTKDFVRWQPAPTNVVSLALQRQARA